MSTRPASTLGTGGVQFKGCGHPDPGHGWNSGRAQLHGGFLAEGSGNDEFALSYYNRGELGFIHEAARNYTLYDRYFCSLLAGPGRTATTSGRRSRAGSRPTRSQPGGNNWETIFDRALGPRPDRALLLLGPALRRPLGGRAPRPGSPRSRSTTRTRAAGTLPNIAIVDPPFKDGGGGDGLSADEHPLGDVRLGQAFQADVVNAFTASPELPPRRAVRDLRRVGRLLRPRPAADACRTTARAPT